MFEKGTKGHAIYWIVEGIILLAAGILALVFCNNRDAYSVALIVVGSLVVASAAINLLFDVVFTILHPIAGAIMSKQGTIITYALELALGIALIIGGVQYHEQLNGGDILRVFNFASLFIGLLLVVASALYLIYAITWVVRAPHEFKLGSIPFFIFFAGALTFGILDLCLIWNSGDDSIMKFLFIAGGILLIGASLFMVISAVMEIVSRKKIKE